MRILIAYAGKSGSTKEMATLLGEQLYHHQVTLADLNETDPDPLAYDYVIFGGAIRMNKLYKAARAYLKTHEKALEQMPHSLFLLCAFSEQFEFYANHVFPYEVLKSAEQVVYFGGELLPANHRGFDKWLVKQLRNSILESEDDDDVLPGLLPEHVRLLADSFIGR